MWPWHQTNPAIHKRPWHTVELGSTQKCKGNLTKEKSIKPTDHTNRSSRNTINDIQYSTMFLKSISGAALVVRWLRIHLPMPRTQVPSLVRELRSHLPQGNYASKVQLLRLHSATRGPHASRESPHITMKT